MKVYAIMFRRGGWANFSWRTSLPMDAGEAITALDAEFTAGRPESRIVRLGAAALPTFSGELPSVALARVLDSVEGLSEVEMNTLLAPVREMERGNYGITAAELQAPPTPATRIHPLLP